MIKIRHIAGAVLVVLLTVSMPVLAQDDSTVRKDLASVLALKGKPCGKITELRQQAENDYLVTCSDGHKYRIFIDAADRVVVEDRK